MKNRKNKKGLPQFTPAEVIMIAIAAASLIVQIIGLIKGG